MNISQRLTYGVKTRLSYTVPYLNHWPQAMYLGLQPSNLAQTLSRIHEVSDEIWYQAGDKSLDVKFDINKDSTHGIQRGDCFQAYILQLKCS